MKEYIFIYGLILIIISCSKKENTPEPSNPSLLTGRVVEYGSGLPIAGVDFNFSFCVRSADFGCAEYRSGNKLTDANGLITIPPEYISSLLSFDSYSFRKDGYWINAKAQLIPVGSDLPPISFFINGSNHADSFQVKLFPLVIVNIHAKNTTTASAETLFNLECRGKYSSNNYSRSGIGIPLRRGIDTTFDYHVFGNVENHLYINKQINGVTVDTVYTHSQFIAKGDNVNFEILY